MENIVSNWIRGYNRLLIWVLLASLTIFLLFYPVHLIEEYHSIQAPYLFDNIWLFVSLFCLWMLILFLIPFSRHEEQRISWEGLVLACIFGLVFIGFWVVIAPHGNHADSIYNMGHVRYLLDNSNIPFGHKTLGYFDFPGIYFLVTALSQVSGLGIFEASMVFTIFNAMLFSALLYVLLVKLLKSNRLAFMGVLLVVMGSLLVDQIRIFMPADLGASLFLGFLILIVPSKGKQSGTAMSDALLIVILFTAIAISYFATSFLAPLILLGIYITQKIGRDDSIPFIFNTIILLLVIILAWEMYWALNTFNSLVGFLPKLYDYLLSGEFLRSILVLLPANIGERLPLWATIVRYFWWGLLGLGTIIGLSRLFGIRKIGSLGRIEIGGLLGVILLTVVGLFAAEGGTQFVRYLLYAPLFCTPILLRFLAGLGGWSKKTIAFLVVLLIVVAPPTFLSSVNTVATDAVRSYETATGRFLELHSREKGENIDLYGTSGASTSSAYYYVPNATHIEISPQGTYDEDKLWAELSRLIESFQEGEPTPEQKIFVIDEKSFNVYEHLLGIPPSHSKWDELRQRLLTANLVYNNGNVQLHTP